MLKVVNCVIHVVKSGVNYLTLQDSSKEMICNMLSITIRLKNLTSQEHLYATFT